MYIVYKLVNSKNEIEYIGETSNLKTRLCMHLTSSKSKFKNRKDLQIIPVKEFFTKKEAFDYQCKLQKKLGFETDLEKYRKNRIPIICYDIHGNYIGIFNSLKDAANELNLNVGNVCRVLKNIVKQTSGYTFEYVKNT
jgi:predicted GIY-YIG superfamily endonuclease